VAGEGQLDEWREDPHPGVPTALGRKHERRLRQIHLARQRLHGHDVQPAAIGEHGQWIARQRPLGKYITQRIAEVLHALVLRRGVPASNPELG
jgi:hypothetical protein